MIPKIIHYCWFGSNPLPKLAKKCIKSWEKFCPDYKIIEWNESNFDIPSAPLYVRQAYEARKWAFVTDYVRLKVVYENGGIYLDTDVEIIKPIDDLLKYAAYFGFELGGYVNTGLGFGAIKGAEILQKLIDDYQNISFLGSDGQFDITPCPVRNMRIFKKFGFLSDNSNQKINNVAVFSSEYFCPKNYLTGEEKITKSTYSIHHFGGSWYDAKQLRMKKRRDRANIINKRKEKIHNFFAKIYRAIFKK